MGRRQEQRAAKRKLQEAAEVENIDMKAGDVRQDAAKRAGAGLKHGLSTRVENGAATRRAEELRNAFEIIEDNQVKIKDARLLRIYYDLKDRGVYDFGKAIKVFRQELEQGDDQDTDEPEEPKGSPHQPAERVLLSKLEIARRTKKRKTTKAPGLKAHPSGVEQQARGHRTSQVSETLGMALSSQPRKPKPRSAPDIDEILWSQARDKAEEELKFEFDIKVSWEEYYLSMCPVGKSMLAATLQQKTQGIYDYKATKKFKKVFLKNKTD